MFEELEDIVEKEYNVTKKDLDTFYKVERYFRTLDAINHIDDEVYDEKFINSLTIDVVETIVDRFFDEYDCNIPENSTWSYVIGQYRMYG